MAQRLPFPGGDLGEWGSILNSFLEIALYNNPNNGSDANNGTLNSNTVGTSQLQAASVTTSAIANNAVTNTQLDSPTQTTLAAVASKYTLPGGGIPYTDLAGNIPASSLSSSSQTNLTLASTAFQPTTTLGGDLIGTLPSPIVSKINGITLPTGSPAVGQVLQATSTTATNWATVTSSGSVSNATTSAPGLVQLAGDLGGISTSATAPTLANTTNVNSIISTNSVVAGATQKTSNLSDLSSATTARTNLGLGTAATISSTAGGDLSGTLPSPTIAKIQGTTISAPSGGATSYLNASGAWTTPSGGSSASNATTSTPGLIELAGDLSGTATSPEVVTVLNGHTPEHTDNKDVANGYAGLTSSGFLKINEIPNAVATIGPSAATYTATRTGTASDELVYMNSTSGTLIYALPASSSCTAGQRITVKDIGTSAAHNTAVGPTNGDTLKADGNGIRIGLSASGAQLNTVVFQTDGISTWQIVEATPLIPPIQTATIFYPEDFGAKGDGSTDDTVAFQACIDAAATVGNAIVQLGPKGYALAATPRTDRGGNAVVALPLSGNGAQKILIQGYKGSYPGSYGGTVIWCNTANTQTYSSSYGSPSVFGGPTIQSTGSNMQNVLIEITNMLIVLPSNPTYSGIDLQLVGSRISDTWVITSDVLFNPGSIAQPTHIWQFGIRTCYPGAYSDIVMGSGASLVMACYAGWVVGTSHTILNNIGAQACQVGIAVVGNDDPINDPHGSTWTYVQTIHCPIHIAGWSETTGYRSLTSGQMFTFVCNMWDIEDASSSNQAWQATTTHLLDANSQMYGKMNFLRVLAGTGQQHGITISGAANVITYDLTVPPYQYQTLTTPPVSATSYANTTDRELNCSLSYTLSPTGSAAADVKVEIGSNTSSYQTWADPNSPISGPVLNGDIQFRLPPTWYYRITATNGTIVGLKAIG